MQRVVRAAILLTKIDFAVIHGLRTRQEQLDIWLTCHHGNGHPNGRPWKTNFNGTEKGQKNPEGIVGTGVSNHQGGLAVDLAARPDGALSWDEKHYYFIDDAMQEAARVLNIPITWSGSWLRDKEFCHWELDRKIYGKEKLHNLKGE